MKRGKDSLLSKKNGLISFYIFYLKFYLNKSENLNELLTFKIQKSIMRKKDKILGKMKYFVKF